MSVLRMTRFRVQNFRNIDDSDWIPTERITTLVGRNESGKTALLKALHKFNPAVKEPYNPQREFPRDRYTRDFNDGAKWPVCSVAFEILAPLSDQIADLSEGSALPTEAICTRFYDDSLTIVLDPPVPEEQVLAKPVIEALETFASAARRLQTQTEDDEESAKTLRTELAAWSSEWQKKLEQHADLRGEDGEKLLGKLRKESDGHANPQTADMVEDLQAAIAPVLEASKEESSSSQAATLIEEHLPEYIYFENYGVLDNAIYLPQFADDLRRKPNDERIRTANAMFKHVGLTAQDILDLGKESAQQAVLENREPGEGDFAQDKERKEARAIKLNSASLDITERFNEWYGQRRHTIEYHADGNYFRIWVSDDKRPGVKIELEARSKGFQWFFSFYLVFLVESDEGHKDAILLLDEPGLHLHPTAQQELINFFERLSEDNQLIYTTHSPFLIDGEHLHRIRPVTEDDAGHSRITIDGWPRDRETIFPLQAAAGYAMVRGLFQHKKNVLVEGISDYHYLHALSAQCGASDREVLPDDIYITPCGGTKNVGYISSLFLGQEVRPLVLLDGDDAGQARKNSLVKELYATHSTAILMLDDILDRTGTETEIEDIIGEKILVQGLSAVIDKSVKLNATDRKKGSLPSQIKAWGTRRDIDLPVGWKASTAIHLVSHWAEETIQLPDEVLDRASTLFKAVNERFRQLEETESIS